jgi:hypothetical protein
MKQEHTKLAEMSTGPVQERLTDLIELMRREIRQTEDERLGALLETAAEVLTGLRTAFEHFEQGQEKAWRKPAAP